MLKLDKKLSQSWKRKAFKEKGLKSNLLRLQYLSKVAKANSPQFQKLKENEKNTKKYEWHLLSHDTKTIWSN